MENGSSSVDRRLFLGASAVTLLAAGGAGAQPGAEPSPQPATGEARRLSDVIAGFITGFDLKAIPPLAIERARLAFIDTVGVTLAGSRSEPAAIVCELVRLEGAAPAASVVG